MSFLLALLSMLIEISLGYPDRLYRLIGHPVTWIGALISALEKRFNQPEQRAATRRSLGVLTLLILILTGLLIGFGIEAVLGTGLALVLTALLASSLLAQRSLATHVAAVAEGLECDGLEGGRKAVSMIVGRDPESLDEAGVARAAIESLSENFSDGIVAPVFWLAILGLPGALIYKCVNTADSMIGHRNERYLQFGWAAARFDDLINLPASRLTGLLLVAAAMILPQASARQAWCAIWRDASQHSSPNAGWPEAAMAGALGLALAGPRNYGGTIVNGAVMGEGGRSKANASDIRLALRLYWIADFLLIALLGLLAFLFIAHG